MLLSEGVVKGRIGTTQLGALTATLPAKTSGPYPRTGMIAAGSDADLALGDSTNTRRSSTDDRHEGADDTSFSRAGGDRMAGTVILRGNVALRDGRWAGAERRGAYPARDERTHVSLAATR